MPGVDWGHAITTEQACWAILKQIKSPIVGSLEKYSTVGDALSYCTKDEVYACLSSGERRLVRIASELRSGRAWWAEDGEGIAALTGLDQDLRRKVWVIIGYLILGKDLPLSDPSSVIDVTEFKNR